MVGLVQVVRECVALYDASRITGVQPRVQTPGNELGLFSGSGKDELAHRYDSLLDVLSQHRRRLPCRETEGPHCPVSSLGDRRTLTSA
jgi:hypothetical protein